MSGPRRHLRLAFAALVAVLVLGSALPSRSAAAVAYRDRTCKAQTFLVLGSFTMNKPATVQTGDLMVATLRTSNLVAFNVAQPAGWTELTSISTPDARTFYRIAQAAEPASSTFASVLGVGSTIVGSIVAFSGVDPTTPIGDTAMTTGSGDPVTLPNVTAQRDGSMRYSVVTSGATVASSAFSGGGSAACDTSSGSISVAGLVEVQGAGASSARTDTRGTTGAYVAQSMIINPPPLPCGLAGTLTLGALPDVTFPTTVLTGLDMTVSTVARFTVDDESFTHPGWTLSATSTAFTNGAQSLADSASSITGVAASAGVGNCSTPTNTGTSYPLTLPAAQGTAPTAVPIYRSAAGTGTGPVNLDVAFSLALPATTRVGTYTSSWTVTLASGP